jgi:hypothetical protein
VRFQCVVKATHPQLIHPVTLLRVSRPYTGNALCVIPIKPEIFVNKKGLIYFICETCFKVINFISRKVIIRTLLLE